MTKWTMALLGLLLSVGLLTACGPRADEAEEAEGQPPMVGETMDGTPPAGMPGGEPVDNGG